MLKNLNLTVVVIGLVLTSHLVSAQEDSVKSKKIRRFREYDRKFQISLFPGISTNGVFSGHYYNEFSLNLFGGVSAGSTLFELGLITNSSFKKSNGIQLAGMANLIGTNAFVNLNVSEERSLINNDFEINFTGIQLAGFMNYVFDNASGIQLTGGMNVVGRNFSGVQIAGIANSAGETSTGVHIAGFFNVAQESVAGLQIASIFNFTEEELSGTQIGLINKNRWMSGKNTNPPTERRGLQIGLVNFSKEMHGMQIGLINFGGDMRGKQFGLINFFNRMGSKEATRMGTPVGILNLGSYGTYMRLYYNEMFPLNAEISTGNCMNCTWTQSTMPYWDFNQQMNQNVLIVSYDRWRESWGFGYGFQKLLYNKSSMNPKDKNNARRMITYGARFIHLNRSMSFDKTMNVVTRLNFDWGSFRWGKVNKWYYWYVGVSANYFVYDENVDTEAYAVNSISFDTGELLGYASKVWPGYNIGLHF